MGFENVHIVVSSFSAETTFRDENTTKTKTENDGKRLAANKSDTQDVEHDNTTFNESDSKTLWLVPAESDKKNAVVVFRAH